MKCLARSYVWWPYLDRDIESTVSECATCQSAANPSPESPLHHWEWPEKSWDCVHIDYTAPFMGYMYLVIIDAHSKWIDLHMTQSSTSTVTIEKLNQTFVTFGLPSSIVSDNGACFTSEEFHKITKAIGIQHLYSSPYHPTSNGLAE